MSTRNLRSVWIGLVGFEKVPGLQSKLLDDKDLAGYCQALALAASANDFVEQIRTWLRTNLNVEAIEFEDIELFESRSKRVDLPADLKERALNVAQDGEPRLDTHVFTSENED